jgi:hypothetical protein
MRLQNDVARCAGVGSDEEGWREGCEDCARRLAESTGDVTAWMMPPAIIAFWCEYRIAPTTAALTGSDGSAATGRSG